MRPRENLDKNSCVRLVHVIIQISLCYKDHYTRFTKDLSAATVETRIIEAFDGKIPPDVDIEIMTSVHSSLTTPNLAPGQLLDGVMIHRIFRQKPLYIRPSQRLLDTGHEKRVVLRCF
jgi:hypothetical protein